MAFMLWPPLHTPLAGYPPFSSVTFGLVSCGVDVLSGSFNPLWTPANSFLNVEESAVFSPFTWLLSFPLTTFWNKPVLKWKMPVCTTVGVKWQHSGQSGRAQRGRSKWTVSSLISPSPCTSRDTLVSIWAVFSYDCATFWTSGRSAIFLLRRNSGGIVLLQPLRRPVPISLEH